MKILINQLRNQASFKHVSLPQLCKGDFDYASFFAAKIQQKKLDNSYRVFKRIQRDNARFPVAMETSKDPKSITIWCSNDYLGLGSHPRVIETIKDVLTKHGSGSGGSRLISGNSRYHEELEVELAKYHQKESCLVFSSGYVANHTALHTLGTVLPDLHYFSDAGNHASIIMGVRTSPAHKQVFRQNSPAHLEEVLGQADQGVPKIVVFETVHSMDGSIAPVERMCDVAHKFGALTFVDEVHAVGMYGDTGSGVGERDNCIDKMDVISSTLGKSFGVMGGYIAGGADLVDVVRSYGSGFIFTTALPPHVMAGCLQSLKILQSAEGKELREKLHDNAAYLKRELEAANIPCIPGNSQVIPVMVGDAHASMRLTNDLVERFGIYVQAINYPSVPRGTERLRVAPTPHHTKLMMDRFVDCLSLLWKEHNLPFAQKDASKGR
ncbi:5-aminolevulinate synthase, erythroid-specific, mitochondrial-like [Physella acuta]|uniref:5-aminolevulinate synthase, erythroid-specific, mitochondrial-like n=1 Tax=Physella acuta TaxID=109671 RepID=UPI0027DBC018|nr:5-aminolevulinate synthase, erythroid-specific, mitochondrial-like [Physella acuta]